MVIMVIMARMAIMVIMARMAIMVIMDRMVLMALIVIFIGDIKFWLNFQNGEYARII